MPRIPGVPELDPVNQPTMSPQEASRGAEAVSRLGEEANQSVLSAFDLEMYIKKAQQHVDSLAAQNDLAKVYADTQNQLSKTQNSRDVDGVIQSANENLNEVSKRWSTSPASIQIQQSADSLRPDLSRIGTVRQVDLMGKEFKITIDQQADILTQDYAATRASQSSSLPPGSTNFTAGPKPKGMVQEGNLPIWNRPTVQNIDGSHSSEYSTSFDEDGKEVLVPTVVNGKFLTPDGKKPPEGSDAEKKMFNAAFQHYKDTGENLGKFSSPDAADAYAETLHNRGSGEQENPALEAFTQSVRGGVKTGLVGDAEAGEYVRQFRQKGQELQIKNAITNANPDVNTKIYEDMEKHRDMFPDVTQEQLDVLKGQALSAFEAHIKQKDWAEGQMALKTQLVPKINQFTNPATGLFDEGAALKDNAERLAKGEITETQSGVLAQGFASHEAQLNVGYKQQAEKTKNDIVDLFHQHKYAEATAALEQHKLDPEFQDMYEGLTKYGDSMKREDRAEYRQERSFQIEQEQDNSNRTFSSLLGSMAHGKIYTDSQIMQMVNGKGSVKPGEMRWQEAQESMGAMRKYESDPQFQSAVKMLDDGFPEAEQTRKQRLAQTHMSAQGKQAEESVINARIEDRKSLTFKAWQARINQNPNEDKVAAMKEVMAPQIQQQITEQIDAAFGTQQAAPSRGILDWFRSSGSSAAPIVQHSSSTGKYRYSTDGGKTWETGQPPR